MGIDTEIKVGQIKSIVESGNEALGPVHRALARPGLEISRFHPFIKMGCPAVNYGAKSIRWVQWLALPHGRCGWGFLRNRGFRFRGSGARCRGACGRGGQTLRRYRCENRLRTTRTNRSLRRYRSPPKPLLRIRRCRCSPLQRFFQKRAGPLQRIPGLIFFRGTDPDRGNPGQSTNPYGDHRSVSSGRVGLQK